MITSAMLRAKTINRIMEDFDKENLQINIRLTGQTEIINGEEFKRVIINAPGPFDFSKYKKEDERLRHHG